MQPARNVERSSLLAWIFFIGAGHNHRPLAAAAAEASAFASHDGVFFLSPPQTRGPKRNNDALSRPFVSSSSFSDITTARRMSGDVEINGECRHVMEKSSRLSHAMLKVPSVDDTVEYWQEEGGRITRSSRERGAATDDGEAAPLGSAFLELGCYAGRKQTATTPREGGAGDGANCFALELVAAKKRQGYTLGNVISHIGISRLAQFQATKENLRELLTKGTAGDDGGRRGEPNGIPVRRTAAAPGDLLARFALRSADLDATARFYAAVLGMKLCFADDDVVCLRYDNDLFRSGLPTTLVFERAEARDTPVPGDCFDHLAIRTERGIGEIYEHVSACECDIFMKPTRMFGAEVMGVLDPNGFKVIIAASR